jgi:hypothetical protein
VWRALIAVWDSDSGPSQAQMALFEDLFGMFHDRVVARFEQTLTGAYVPTAATA